MLYLRQKRQRDDLRDRKKTGDREKAGDREEAGAVREHAGDRTVEKRDGSTEKDLYDYDSL